MPISKKLRFDVFKRDGFTCQYCGRTPPTITLEVDHLIAKSQGGSDELDNLTTSCFDCNRGKGKSALKQIPESLAVTLKAQREKQEQFIAYNDFIKAMQAKRQEDSDHIQYLFNTSYPQYSLNDNFILNTVHKFLNLLPEAIVGVAMEKACAKFPASNKKQESSQSDRAIRYFCGICWNWIKHPETRDW